MPWKDPAQRRAAQAAYKRTPQGRAAAARSHARFIAKRRGEHIGAPGYDFATLFAVLQQWRDRSSDEGSTDLVLS